MPLDPAAVGFLKTVAASNAPGWNEMTPEAGRKVFASRIELFGKGPKLSQVSDLMLGGRIRARAFYPFVETAPPVILYFHGGGWVLGDIGTHDALCRCLAHDSRCAVVSVDYRRAPEHRFPAAFDDCFAATRSVAEGGRKLGLDASKMVVAGDSAGGNLAAAVALRARDEGGPALKMQVLVYPVVEPRFDTASYMQCAQGHGLTRAAMMWFWEQYLGPDLTQAGDYAALPKAASLRNLPPAHVLTAEYDVLRDEGESFAAQLKDAGVSVTHRRYDGMIHGFVHMSGVFERGRQAITDVASAIRAGIDG